MALFTTGQLPHNTLTDDAITTREFANGLKYKFIRLEKNKWRELHKVNWEKANGDIPKGHILRSIDGNTLNADASNWRPITRAEHLRLNQNIVKRSESMKATMLLKKGRVNEVAESAEISPVVKLKKLQQKAREINSMISTLQKEINAANKLKSRQAKKEQRLAETEQARKDRAAARETERAAKAQALAEEREKNRLLREQKREAGKQQRQLERQQAREEKERQRKEDKQVANKPGRKPKPKPELTVEQRAKRAYKKREPNGGTVKPLRIDTALAKERRMEQERLATKKVDYSQKRMLKIDNKTFIYIGINEDPEEAKHKFFKAYARAGDIPFNR